MPEEGTYMSVQLEGETPISELGFSKRVYNTLKRNGIPTAEILLGKSKEELMGLRNFGEKSYAEAHRLLSEMELIDPNEEDIVLMPEVLKRNAEGGSRLYIYILAQVGRSVLRQKDSSQQS